MQIIIVTARNCRLRSCIFLVVGHRPEYPQIYSQLQKHATASLCCRAVATTVELRSSVCSGLQLPALGCSLAPAPLHLRALLCQNKAVQRRIAQNDTIIGLDVKKSSRKCCRSSS
jgi:hypothetical protein